MVNIKSEEDDANKAILRRQNLKRLIRETAGKASDGTLNTKIFHKKLRVRMLRTHTEDQFLSLRARLYKFYTGVSLSKASATTIENAFSMQPGDLSQSLQAKAPIYVLISCAGGTVNTLFKSLCKQLIVDEVAIIAGNSDLFVRLYGTSLQIKYFLIELLYTLDGAKGVTKTTTYFSFENSYWLRYPIQKHPGFSSNKKHPG